MTADIELKINDCKVFILNLQNFKDNRKDIKKGLTFIHMLHTYAYLYYLI